MHRRFAIATTVGLALALAAGVTNAQYTQSQKPKKEAVAKVGQPAPNFTLKDTAGKPHKLADYKGKIVVLQWINPDCPVCKGVTKDGRVTKMLTDSRKIDTDVVHLAINSTHYMKPAASAKYFKQYKIKSPALIDQDGTVGKLYGARTTPHVFVIDEEGVLRYAGAIDNDRRGSMGPEATNYVVNAIQQISEGDTVTPDTTKAYGCKVKYAKK